MKKMKKAYLVLGNGAVFEGFRFGADGDTIGELVFTTGVCGYIETLTDPAFCGQIVLQTFPLIGNYGMIPEDFDGKCALNGYVVREWCEAPSNFRCEKDLDTYLKEQGVVALCGIDTREVTRIIRESGVMSATICSTPPQNLSELNSYRVSSAVPSVSCTEPKVYPADNETAYRVTVLDFGVQQQIIRELTQRGCEVTVVPHNTSAEAILAAKPDGVLLSGGPGDPQENADAIETIRCLLGKLPLFGIGLGHQLLALANGGKTEKLKYGHRGGNQPVRSTENGCTYITGQNHGYVVLADSLAGKGVLSFVNGNDNTCEGIQYPALNAFSVQFLPESVSGPRSTAFVYDQFITLMGGNH